MLSKTLSITKSKLSITHQDYYEQIITDIWCSILPFPVEKLDPNDNFFDIGGDSFMLARLRLLINEKLNQDIKMIDLLEYSTIRSLAKYLMYKSNNTDVSF